MGNALIKNILRLPSTKSLEHGTLDDGKLCQPSRARLKATMNFSPANPTSSIRTQPTTSPFTRNHLLLGRTSKQIASRDCFLPRHTTDKKNLGKQAQALRSNSFWNRYLKGLLAKLDKPERKWTKQLEKSSARRPCMDTGRPNASRVCGAPGDGVLRTFPQVADGIVRSCEIKN